MANKSLVFKDVKLIFTNWAGARDRFGNEGKRHFSFILDEEQAEALHQAGVNVKRLKPRDKDDEPAPYVKVNVKYGVRPPKVTMISGGKRTFLDEESIGMLDWAEIDRVDLAVRTWRGTQSPFTSLYLDRAFITVVEDELDAMYREDED